MKPVSPRVLGVAPSLLAALALLAGGGCSSTDGRAAHERGLELAREGNVDGAMEAFQEAVSAEPGFDDARFDLARLEFETGVRNHRVALDHLRESRRLAEDSRQQAEPYFRAALDNFTAVLDDWGDDHPNAAWLHHLIARCHIFFEEYDVAQDELRRALDLANPTGSVRKDIEEALVVLERRKAWSRGE